MSETTEHRGIYDRGSNTSIRASVDSGACPSVRVPGEGGSGLLFEMVGEDDGASLGHVLATLEHAEEWARHILRMVVQARSIEP